MQTQHHLREAEARAVDGDARLAGQCNLEPAAEAKAVDDRDRRQPQSFQMVDHRMRGADARLHHVGIGRATEFVDVGARDEAGRFCGADHETGGTFGFDRREHGVEFLHHLGGQRVGACISAIEQEPGDAVGIARQLEVPVWTVRRGLGAELKDAVAKRGHDLGIHGHTASISMAPPSPPPMHSVAIPRRVLPLHRVNEMQHDAVAGGADGMTERDRAAIDVEPVTVDLTSRAVKPEDVPAEFVVVPGGEATEHLGGEGLVQLPGLDVLNREAVALKQRRCRHHRTEPHDAGIERRPVAVHDRGFRRQSVLGDRGVGGQDHPGGAVGDLRRIAGGDLAPGALEHRPEFCERLCRGVRTYAIVMVEELAVAGEGGLDLALQEARALRMREPAVAFSGIGIGLCAGDAEEMADHLGGLAHVQIGDRIGQPALEADDRLEVARPQFERRSQLGGDALGGGKAGEPAHARIGPDQRRVAQRLGAAGEDHVGMAFADVAIGAIDRLHPGAAIDLHGEGDHVLAHAEPERGDTGRVHLVGDHVDAAEDDLIEAVGRKRLARQERPSALHGQIDRRERPRSRPRLQKRRATAVDDENRSCHQLAALWSPSSWKN